MKRVETVLRKFGLTDNEIKVYLTVLKQKDTSHNNISKACGVARTTVYDVIDSLEQKDLVQTIQQENQTHIVPQNPNQLIINVKERLGELRELEADVSSIAANLFNKFDNKEDDSDQKLYKGLEGARKAYFAEDFVTTTLPRHIITDLTTLNTFGEEDRQNTYPYEIKELIPVNDWVKFTLKKWLRDDPDFVKKREYRFIDNPVLQQYTRTTILSDKVLHACAFKNEAWGLIIESKAYAESQLAMFNYLWSQSEKLTVEKIQSWPEITTPSGVVDSPSISIQGGSVKRITDEE
ncbi:hypothetical protein KC669_01940 [Candidatus Dojkabacteria bacterium]|uniref:Transcription regulator TrmB N-terminal domain-containing protein n=1 Tax=Candidatus Dojkabacteria bacterium TaxID=2099670 RepID=A0A955RLX5_9BACT|nr:hypothetical protein [Candidatus Dojkabacteria bacterium]